MSFVLYFAVCLIYMWLCEKVGITDKSESTAIILAILTGAEVISWRIKRWAKDHKFDGEEEDE